MNDRAAAALRLSAAHGFEAPAPPATMDPDLAGRVRKFLFRLMNTPPALSYFNEPVDPDALGIPEYREIIKHPMDLGTISARVQAGAYGSPADVRRDIALVASNAKLFNAAPDHPVAIAADKLLTTADSMWRTMKLDAAAERAARPPPPPPPRPAQKAARQAKAGPVAGVAGAPAAGTSFDWRARAAAVVDLVRTQCAAAAPFLTPVDAAALGLTDYHTIIARPMDLGTIAARLAADAVTAATGAPPRFYLTPAAVAADAALTFDNCRLYNAPGTPIVAAADATQAYFDAAWRTAGLAAVGGAAPAVAAAPKKPKRPPAAPAAPPPAKKQRPPSSSGRCAVCRVARRGGCGTPGAARGCERAGLGPPVRGGGGGGGSAQPSADDPFKPPPRAPPPLPPVDARPTPQEEAALAAAADLARRRAAADAAVRAADAAARAASRRASTAGTVERRAAAAEAAHRGAMEAAPVELWAPADVVPVEAAASTRPVSARPQLAPATVAAFFAPRLAARPVPPAVAPTDAVDAGELAASFKAYAAPAVKSGE